MTYCHDHLFRIDPDAELLHNARDTTMLILLRRAGEVIVCQTADGKKIEFLVCAVERNRVRIGVKADQSISIDRLEVYKRKRAETDEVSGNAA